MKSARKIRKTNDLLCFKSPTKENICPENNVHRKKSSITLQHFENSAIMRTVENKDVKKIRKQSILTQFNSATYGKENSCTDAFNFEINKSELSLPPEEPLINDNMKKRKIIKAKRLLRNCSNRQNDYLEQLESDGDTKNCMILKSIDHLLNRDSEHKSYFVAEDLNITQDIVHSKGEIDMGIYFNTEKEQEKSSSPLNLITETISSAVSPSLNSTHNNLTSPQLEHLHFNSSKEELYPSTSGNVESSSRRRTYELEESITDISLLKSASEKDSIRMSSFIADEDEDSAQCKTPTDQKYSRITLRKKWDKVNTFSPCEDGPSWCNTSIESSIKKNTLKFQNLREKVLSKEHKTSSSTKKYVSKIRIPNFAAIHQKALNKVESIAEYKQRTEDRAKMLLSGRKPTVMTSSSKKTEKKITPIKKEKSVKHLRFAPDTSLKEKSPTFIPLPSTPLPKQFMHKTESFAVIQPFRFGVEKSVDVKISNESKEYKPLLKAKTLEKKIFAPNNKEYSHKAFDSYPVLTKDNLKKSVVTKSKPAVDMLESRRYAIKGVRSNRRFELLMNMRKGK